MPDLLDLKIESVMVRQGASAVGRSPAEMELRRRVGALVLAVRREGGLVTGGEQELRCAVGDIVYVVGNRESVKRVAALLGEGESQEEPRA